MAVAVDFTRRLHIERYFVGRLKAWGVFQDRFGKLRRQFEADAFGSWDGKTLTLVEDFIYDNGQAEQRTWRIEKVGEAQYRGRADGVIGLAEGAVSGNALNWSYRFALAIGGRTWTVRFNDWMFLHGDDMLINRAEVTRFGLRLGQVICVFRKIPSKGGSEFPVAEAQAG